MWTLLYVSLSMTFLTELANDRCSGQKKKTPPLGLADPGAASHTVRSTRRDSRQVNLQELQQSTIMASMAGVISCCAILAYQVPAASPESIRDLLLTLIIGLLAIAGRSLFGDPGL